MTEADQPTQMDLEERICRELGVVMPCVSCLATGEIKDVYGSPVKCPDCRGTKLALPMNSLPLVIHALNQRGFDVVFFALPERTPDDDKFPDESVLIARATDSAGFMETGFKSFWTAAAQALGLNVEEGA